MLWRAALALLCLDAAFALLVTVAAHHPPPPEVRISLRGLLPPAEPVPPPREVVVVIAGFEPPRATPPREIVVAITGAEPPLPSKPALPRTARFWVAVPIREPERPRPVLQMLADGTGEPIAPGAPVLADRLTPGAGPSGAGGAPAADETARVATRTNADLDLPSPPGRPEAVRAAATDSLSDRLEPGAVMAPRSDRQIEWRAAGRKPATDQLIAGARQILAETTPRPVAPDGAADRLDTGAAMDSVAGMAAVADETGSAAVLAARADDLRRAEPNGSAAAAPSVLLARWMPDLGSMAMARDRKTVFVRVLLPLVNQENERLLRWRDRVIELEPAIAAGRSLAERDARFVAQVLKEVRLDSWDLHEILLRLDAVPPSMALAQAAQESGWGSSRPAREDNALFGQMMFPPDSAAQLQPFTDLLQTVGAYVRNLNTHSAYAEFRRRRAALRARGGKLDGHVLMAFLERYSELGRGYVEAVRQIIRMNNLSALDATPFAEPRGMRGRGQGIDN